MDNIKPYTKNAKKHPDKQLKQIAKSIKEFGWQQPIVVDKDGIIIVGHGRYFAYEKYGKEMDLPKPDIKKASNLTKQQVSAYRLADNKLNESDWDLDLAIEDLKELDDYYFELTGFDQDELMLNSVESVDVDMERMLVITVEAPEAPKLKERMAFYCDSIQEYKKIEKAFKQGRVKLNKDKLLEMIQ